jgi:hypothetical protein
MNRKELYSPKRQIRIIEQGTETVILTPDGIAPTPLAKALCAEAEAFKASKLWSIMVESLRADAVKIGIVDYTVEEHARYAKAIYFVLGMMEGTIEELAKLKI